MQFSEETGRELGLQGEAAHARWAFIMCKTNGRILNEPEALSFIKNGPRSPDEQVRVFMEETIKVFRAEAGRGRG